MGGGYFCGCFWHFSADVLHSVGQVPATAGDSRSWCQAFSLGACIFESLRNTNLFEINDGPSVATSLSHLDVESGEGHRQCL
jgi:hypothetical protein